jgi:hypothetical protein
LTVIEIPGFEIDKKAPPVSAGLFGPSEPATVGGWEPAVLNNEADEDSFRASDEETPPLKKGAAWDID